MINLKNDYSSIIDKKIFLDLEKKLNNKYDGYGLDLESKKLNKLVCNKCQKDVDTYILSGGTITNIIGLSKILSNPYDGVMCVSSSHINVHETAAIESSGHKIIYLPSIGGKIDISKIEETYFSYTDFHMVKPKAIYLSNASELGETYSLVELKEIYRIAKKHNLYVFIDGARLAQAFYKEKYTFSDIAKVCDMFYFGGTKLGLPYGELLIIVNDLLKKDFKYLLKNKLGLLAKGFVPAILFNSLLEDDYYLSLAKASQDKAKIIASKLKDFLAYPLQTNQIFLRYDNDFVDKLKKKIMFEVWERNDKSSIIRLVTSYDTPSDDVSKALDLLCLEVK